MFSFHALLTLCTETSSGGIKLVKYQLIQAIKNLDYNKLLHLFEKHEKLHETKFETHNNGNLFHVFFSIPRFKPAENIFQLLIDKKVDFYYKDKFGNTALHLSVTQMDKCYLKKLLALENINLAVTDNLLNTIFHIAVYAGGNDKYFSSLTGSGGAASSGSPAKDHKDEEDKKKAQEGVGVPKLLAVPKHQRKNRNRNAYDVMETLIEYLQKQTKHKKELEKILLMRNADHYSCLDIACSSQAKIVSLLLDHLPSLSPTREERQIKTNETSSRIQIPMPRAVITDKYFYLPMYFAILNDRKDIMELLISKNKVFLTINTTDDASPLMTAAKHYSLEALEYLLEFDNIIDIHETDTSGSNILHILSYYPLSHAPETKPLFFRVLRKVFDYGVDLKQPVNDIGFIPLHFAAFANQPDTVEFFVNEYSSRDIPISLTNIIKDNALHIACKNLNFKMIKILVEAGYEDSFPNFC